MKTKEIYYTNENLESMSSEELREVVKEQQQELQTLRWNLKDVQELLIAAIQSLPKTVKL